MSDRAHSFDEKKLQVDHVEEAFNTAPALDLTEEEKAIEKKMVWKLDRIIIPMTALLYVSLIFDFYVAYSINGRPYWPPPLPCVLCFLQSYALPPSQSILIFYFISLAFGLPRSRQSRKRQIARTQPASRQLRHQVLYHLNRLFHHIRSYPLLYHQLLGQPAYRSAYRSAYPCTDPVLHSRTLQHRFALALSLSSLNSPYVHHVSGYTPRQGYLSLQVHRLWMLDLGDRCLLHGWRSRVCVHHRLPTFHRFGRSHVSISFFFALPITF